MSSTKSRKQFRVQTPLFFNCVIEKNGGILMFFSGPIWKKILAKHLQNACSVSDDTYGIA